MLFFVPPTKARNLAHEQKPFSCNRPTSVFSRNIHWQINPIPPDITSYTPMVWSLCQFIEEEALVSAGCWCGQPRWIPEFSLPEYGKMATENPKNIPQFTDDFFPMFRCSHENIFESQFTVACFWIKNDDFPARFDQLTGRSVLPRSVSRSRGCHILNGRQFAGGGLVSLR